MLNFFRRIGYFVKNAFSRRGRRRTGEYEASSRFKTFYENLDPNDPLYPAVRHAATLCDDALRTARRRMRINAQLHEVQEKLAELDAFVKLTDEEVENLKKMLDRFMALSRERSAMLERLEDYDPSLVDMTPLEDDARAGLPTIKDAEKLQRALRSDIGYLMGEKEELIHERGEMAGSLNFIRKFTFAAVGVFVAAGAWLAFQFFGARQEVFIPAVVLVVLMMGTVSLLYLFRRRLRREMRLNLRRQHRAVELLNKKNVVYAYYTNFLRFCYDKYKSKNSRVLESNLNDLESYRHLTNRIDTVRSLLYETEEAIDLFIRTKKLTGIKATIEGFAEAVKLDDKRRRIAQLEAQKEAAERDLNELEKRHEEVWEVIMALGEADKTHRINAVIETYLAEAGKLFHTEELFEK